MFIGRWQPFHAGHQWLVDQRLNIGKNVLICIRDVKPDDKNPFKPIEVYMQLVNRFAQMGLSERVKIMIIPDIESVNYGRDVGYEVIEHVPPQEIREISATKIREQLKTQNHGTNDRPE
jgi:cytidyltransferase-like protein